MIIIIMAAEIHPPLAIVSDAERLLNVSHNTIAELFKKIHIVSYMRGLTVNISGALYIINNLGRLR